MPTCEPTSNMSEKDRKEAETDDITQVGEEKTFRHMPRKLYVDTGIEQTEENEKK